MARKPQPARLTFTAEKNYKGRIVTLTCKPDDAHTLGVALDRPGVWRAFFSHWDETTRTVSGVRDYWNRPFPAWKDAQRFLEPEWSDFVAGAR